jgi:hypothetical protein
MLDGTGDDLYEYDYFSHGGGYWFAVGLARDFGGNDRRVGATRERFDGEPRTEARFVRWGPAYGCHYALGFLFDDAGDDEYVGSHGSVAFAWDIAVAALIDADGDDRYEVRSGGLAQAHNAGFAVLADGAGNDEYVGRAPGLASAAVDYHPDVDPGGNFAFMLDFGGEDSYSSGAANGVRLEQGWGGGFLIDWPLRPDEDGTEGDGKRDEAE